MIHVRSRIPEQPVVSRPSVHSARASHRSAADALRRRAYSHERPLHARHRDAVSRTASQSTHAALLHLAHLLPPSSCELSTTRSAAIFAAWKPQFAPADQATAHPATHLLCDVPTFASPKLSHPADSQPRSPATLPTHPRHSHRNGLLLLFGRNSLAQRQRRLSVKRHAHQASPLVSLQVNRSSCKLQPPQFPLIMDRGLACSWIAAANKHTCRNICNFVSFWRNLSRSQRLVIPALSL